jgi:hypothetical protein
MASFHIFHLTANTSSPSSPPHFLYITESVSLSQRFSCHTAYRDHPPTGIPKTTQAVELLPARTKRPLWNVLQNKRTAPKRRQCEAFSRPGRTSTLRTTFSPLTEKVHTALKKSINLSITLTNCTASLETAHTHTLIRHPLTHTHMRHADTRTINNNNYIQSCTVSLSSSRKIGLK